MDGYKLVMDVSHHQTFDYDLVKQHVDGFIIRTAFGTERNSLFQKHYDGFKEKPCAGYQWFRPDQDVTAQIETVKLACEGKTIRCIFSDQEQAGRYNIPMSNFSAAVLNERANEHVTGLELHGFEMGIYSRATWISQFVPQLTNWMYDYNVWLASWPYAVGAVNASWDELMDTWAPKIFSPYFTLDWPANKKRADAWQWSGDKFIVPGVFTADGVPRSADFNFVSNALFAHFSRGEVTHPAGTSRTSETAHPPATPRPSDTGGRLTLLERDMDHAKVDIDRIENVMRDHDWAI